MKKIFLFASFLLFILACNQSPQSVSKSKTDSISTSKNSIKYTCPMHPEVVQSKPGVCPKCGMDLVEKE